MTDAILTSTSDASESSGDGTTTLTGVTQDDGSLKFTLTKPCGPTPCCCLCNTTFDDWPTTFCIGFSGSLLWPITPNPLTITKTDLTNCNHVIYRGGPITLHDDFPTPNNFTFNVTVIFSAPGELGVQFTPGGTNPAPVPPALADADFPIELSPFTFTCDPFFVQGITFQNFETPGFSFPIYGPNPPSSGASEEFTVEDCSGFSVSSTEGGSGAMVDPHELDKKPMSSEELNAKRRARANRQARKNCGCNSTS